MRLLQYDEDDRITLTKDLSDDEAERRRYAILSHTWGEDEVLLHELQEQSVRRRAGYRKILFCAQQARKDGLRYFWVDTCCIDKANSVELGRAINSMFRWYHQAEKCYVYLPDVTSPLNSESSWETEFRSAKWFTRGWTLQELLAPESVEFFSRQGEKLGDKSSLEKTISQITGIQAKALRDNSFSNYSTEERFSWMDERQTTEEEDLIYSLLGIFDVSMTVIYGEKRHKARKRLELEIENASKGRYHENFSLPYNVPDESGVTPYLARKLELYESHMIQLKELHQLSIQEKDELHSRIVSALRRERNLAAAEKDELSKKIEQTTKQAQGAEDNLAASEHETNSLQQVVSNLTAENRRLKEQLQFSSNRIFQLEQAAVEMGAGERETTFSKQMQKLQNACDKRLMDMTLEVEALHNEASRREHNLTLEIKKRNDGHIEVMRRLEQDHALSVQENESRFMEYRDSSQRELEVVATKHSMEVAKLQAVHNDERDRIIKNIGEEKRWLQSNFEKERQHLRRQIQELNDALLSRDTESIRISFTSPDVVLEPDDKLRCQFESIQSLVEDLGQIPWRSTADVWTPHIVDRDHQTFPTRKLRKAIVQDLVWSFLLKYIFFSPFRMFGVDGRKLENEWFEQCSRDRPSALEVFPWPAPGANAERWRYSTIRECRYALTKPISELDPRNRLRQEFVSSMKELTEHLRKGLDDIVELDPDRVQLISRLSKIAAKVWITFQEQRCRLKIDVYDKEGRSTLEEAGQAPCNRIPFVLTLRPKFGRFGNAKGSRLDEWTNVGGREAERLFVLWKMEDQLELPENANKLLASRRKPWQMPVAEGPQ